MKTRIAILVSLLLAFGQAYADEKNADAHKSAKAKSAAAKKPDKKADNKSDKNAAQKAESSVTDWADKHNIWKRSSK